MHSAQQSIATYIRAKDENRPHLMPQVFSEAATLEIFAKAESLSFPPLAQGLEAISDVLVRRFAQTYENVHTFCLTEPPNIETCFSCNWLVGMSEKDSRLVRVGCGRYDWLFQRDGPGLADRLTITIDLMQSLAPIYLAPVMNWLSQIPYPWCSPERALRDAPTLDELQPIREYLARESA